MWQSIIFGIILIALGLIEARATIHYAKFDAKNKEIVTGPVATYSGAVFSILFILFGIGLVLGTTPVTHFNHLLYVVMGIILIVVSILVFLRGRKISQNLKKGESNFQVVQAYWISAIVLISGIVSLFR